MNTSDFDLYEDYRKLSTPIKLNGFEIVGWFPYEVAQLAITCVRVPRKIFDHIHTALYINGINDNKFVIICRDVSNWDTESFAIQFKDSYCKIGKLKEVQGYALKEMKLKKGTTL